MGAMPPVQFANHAQLAGWLGSSLLATLFAFVVGVSEGRDLGGAPRIHPVGRP
jgi:hypothetical protein